jgi:hypothetical protein
MNAPSVDIKDMLEAQSSLGLTFGTNLFIGREPTSPDNCVTIFDTPGGPPALTLDNIDYNYPSIQVRVRNNDYLTGWGLIDDIKNFLHGKSHETWNGTRYELIACTVEPAMLDWDENNRARFVTTFNIQRR